MSDAPDSTTYRSYADLARAQRRGRDYEIRVRRIPESRIAIIAPHGGEIENGTSEIASAIAGGEFNLYLLEGLRPVHNYRALHLTSHRFDEPECLALLSDCSHVVAIHGCAGTDERVLLGGLDSTLRDRLALAIAATGVPAQVGGHRFPATQAANICNRGTRGMGVQVEFTEPLREPGAAAVVTAAMVQVLRSVVS
jgi:phage replication-related protein YjqB (UPF0714/DUF867 family)